MTTTDPRATALLAAAVAAAVLLSGACQRIQYRDDDDLDDDATDDDDLGDDDLDDDSADDDSAGDDDTAEPWPPRLYVESDADAHLQGTENEEYAGEDISCAGDANGDGLDDVFIGAVYHDGDGENIGAAFLARGPLQGTIPLDAVDATLVGDKDIDDLGNAVAMVGDVDGDGFGDLVVSDPEEQLPDRVHLFYGPLPDGVSVADDAAGATLMGAVRVDGVHDRAGFAVAGAGDTDGDGRDDVLIGAPHYARPGDEHPIGRAYLLQGPVWGEVDLEAVAATLDGTVEREYAGTAVAAAGDVDGDGLGDVLVGAHDYSDAVEHAVYLVLAPIEGSMSLADAYLKIVPVDVLIGAGSNQLGHHSENIATAGDVNGDGLADIVVGDECETIDTSILGVGAAYLFFGTPPAGVVSAGDADVIIYGSGESDRIGTVVSAAGDVDGDGVDDLLVGGQSVDLDNIDSGAVFLFRGPLSPGVFSVDDADLVFTSAVFEGCLGQDVSSGDVNGDGYSDVLISAQDCPSTFYNFRPGDIYLFYGGPDLWPDRRALRTTGTPAPGTSMHPLVP